MKPWVRRYIRDHHVDPEFVRDVYTKMGMSDDEYEVALRELLTEHRLVTTSGTNTA